MKRVAALVMAPLLAYPAAFASLGLTDTLSGERLLAFRARHEQRALWDVFWSDFVASLPVAYVLVAVVVAALLLLRGLAPGRVPPWAVVPLAALAGWAGASYLSGSLVSVTHACLAVAGAVVGVPLAYSMTPSRDGKETLP